VARTRRVGVWLVALGLAAAGLGFGGDVSPRDGIVDGSLTPEQAAQRPEADQLIVSIGDSVASGEGNPDVRGRLGRPPKWLLAVCHRSLLSGHAQAALAIERDDLDTDVSFVPLGCSGATVHKGLLGEYLGQPKQVDQVNALAERRQIDALLVSVGANDAYFAPLVKRCLFARDCPDRPFEGRTTMRAAIEEALDDLARSYDELDVVLSHQIDRDRVVIVEYFDPTRGDGGRFCQLDFLGGRITPDEARWMHEEVVRPLNEVVHAAAERHGWRVVEGVDEAFEGHGVCARPEREVWARTLEQSLFRQNLNHQGGLHPNARGHRATARLIHPVLADVLGVTATDPGDDTGGDDDEGDWLDDGDLLLAIAAGLLVVGVLVFLVLRRRRA
jgi:lysophospholipase L1-like esterase